MEVILLGIYSFFVWLIFIKLKLLPWTTPWKVGVAIFPIVCLAILLLLLNVVAPTTTDVRVVKYIVPVVSQVRGRVIEVPVENNRPVKKGDVLFRIDPTPYQNEVELARRRNWSPTRPRCRPTAPASTKHRLACRTPWRENASWTSSSSRRPARSPRCSPRSISRRKRVAQNTELVAVWRR